MFKRSDKEFLMDMLIAYEKIMIDIKEPFILKILGGKLEELNIGMITDENRENGIPLCDFELKSPTIYLSSTA